MIRSESSVEWAAFASASAAAEAAAAEAAQSPLAQGLAAQGPTAGLPHRRTSSGSSSLHSKLSVTADAFSMLVLDAAAAVE